MKLLGSVQEVTFEGRLVVRGSFAPPIAATVTDNRMRPLGRVARVFGPVASPYVSVEPMRGQTLLSVVGKQVYVEEVEPNAKAKGRDRRDRKMS
jgi:RNA-binding protein